MGLNFIAFCILCAFLTVFSSITTTNAKSLTLKDREKIGNFCMKQTGIELQMVENAVKKAQEGHAESDDKYLDYIVCSYKLQGYLDPKKSEILYDNISDFLANYYSSDEVTFVMTPCKEIKHSNPKQLVYNVLSCLMKKLHEVDETRKENEENKKKETEDINTNTVE